MDELEQLISVGALLLIYFLPALVAGHRHHRNAMSIGVLNLLLGWTVLGWIIALVWASSADVLPRKG